MNYVVSSISFSCLSILIFAVLYRRLMAYNNWIFEGCSRFCKIIHEEFGTLPVRPLATDPYLFWYLDPCGTWDYWCQVWSFPVTWFRSYKGCDFQAFPLNGTLPIRTCVALTCCRWNLSRLITSARSQDLTTLVSIPPVRIAGMYVK